MISRPWDSTAWEHVTINNEIWLHSFVIGNLLLSGRGRGFVNTGQEFHTKGGFSNMNFKLLYSILFMNVFQGWTLLGGSIILQMWILVLFPGALLPFLPLLWQMTPVKWAWNLRREWRCFHSCAGSAPAERWDQGRDRGTRLCPCQGQCSNTVQFLNSVIEISEYPNSFLFPFLFLFPCPYPFPFFFPFPFLISFLCLFNWVPLVSIGVAPK